jgi:hypothetical protein
MMNRELKQKWINALRSGSYIQGRNRLRNLDNSFCCLGVLCDIVDNSKWERGKYQYIYSYHAYHSSYHMLRKLMTLSHQIELINLNDKEKADFNQIADWIERNL